MKRRVVSIFMIALLTCAAPVHGQAQELFASLENAPGQGISAEETLFCKWTDYIRIHDRVQEEVEKKDRALYTAANVNFREHPGKKAQVMEVLPFQTKIRGYRFNDEWYVAEYDGMRGFVHAEYVSEKPVKSSRHKAPANTIKSFMSYRAITLKSSPQYELQREYAYTGEYGVRQINGRFCAALGSAYTTQVGQYFDLILKNGTCIPCILADQKADRDTDASHRITYDGSLAEFIVDTDAISGRVWHSGDIGSACPAWDSPVKTVRIYEKNLLTDKSY